MIETAPIEGVVSVEGTPNVGFYALSDEWEESGEPDDIAGATQLVGTLLDLAPVKYVLDRDTPTSGTFRLELTTDAFGSTTEESANIAFDATSIDIATALGLMSTVLSDSPDVSGVEDGTFTITLANYVIGDNILDFSISNNSLINATPTLTESVVEPTPQILRSVQSGEALFLDEGEERRVGVMLDASDQPTGGSVRLLIEISSPS